jgi:hypothetical protein
MINDLSTNTMTSNKLENIGADQNIGAEENISIKKI